MRKIAAFDFCETLVSFQTADRFVRYSIHCLNDRYRNTQYKLFCLKQKCYYYRFQDHLTSGSMHGKKALLKILKGLPEEKITNLAEEYYMKSVRPAFIRPVVQYLNELQEDGYRIVILSAGYSPYIQFFCREFGAECIANNFEYRNHIFTGRLERDDCYGAEKVRRFYEEIGEKTIDHLVFVSDSMSDRPMFEIADECVYVINSTGSVEKKWSFISWE